MCCVFGVCGCLSFSWCICVDVSLLVIARFLSSRRKASDFGPTAQEWPATFNARLLEVKKQVGILVGTTHDGTSKMNKSV